MQFVIQCRVYTQGRLVLLVDGKGAVPASFDCTQYNYWLLQSEVLASWHRGAAHTVALR